MKNNPFSSTLPIIKNRNYRDYSLCCARQLVLAKPRKNPYGTWTLDETTVYEFNGKGHGTLHLPLESYDFSYTIEDGFLTIDFADETATDAGYRYTRSGSALTLDTNTGMVYRFREQKR